jgi:hypothetical protein
MTDDSLLDFTTGSRLPGPVSGRGVRRGSISCPTLGSSTRQPRKTAIAVLAIARTYMLRYNMKKSDLNPIMGWVMTTRTRMN